MQARTGPRVYVAVLLALPAAIFLLNHNWPFQSFGDYDAFFYFGHFIHFPHYQKLQPTYAGERLPWILPGYLLVHLLRPVYGVLALHFVTYYTSIFSLYSIVKTFSGPQSGFLAACMLGVHPYFLAANGMDYLTGGSIAYCLLTFVFIVWSANAVGPIRWLYSFAAGISWAAVIFTYPLWIAFTPACVAVYVAANELKNNSDTKLRYAISSAGMLLAGGIAATLILIVMHHWIYGTGGLGFQSISLGVIRAASHMREDFWGSKSFSVTYADWLVFPGAAAVLSLVMLIPSCRRWLQMREGTDKLLWMYLCFFTVMTIMTIQPSRILEFDYFASGGNLVSTSPATGRRLLRETPASPRR